MSDTLLLADDSVTMQRVVELTFAEQGLNVVSVSDGQQAIDYISRHRPALALVSASLQKVNGFDVARYVRDHPVEPRMPVVLLAGAFDTIDDAHVRESGASGVLVKPFEPALVIKRVKELLGMKSDAPRPVPVRPQSSGRLVTSGEGPDRPDSPAPASSSRPAATGAAPGGSVEPASEESARDAHPRAVEGPALAGDYLDQLDAAFDNLDAQLAGRSAPAGRPTTPPPAPRVPAALDPSKRPSPPIAESAYTTTPVDTGSAASSSANPVFEVDENWFEPKPQSNSDLADLSVVTRASDYPVAPTTPSRTEDRSWAPAGDAAAQTAGLDDLKAIFAAAASSAPAFAPDAAPSDKSDFGPDAAASNKAPTIVGAGAGDAGSETDGLPAVKFGSAFGDVTAGKSDEVPVATREERPSAFAGVPFGATADQSIAPSAPAASVSAREESHREFGRDHLDAAPGRDGDATTYGATNRDSQATLASLPGAATDVFAQVLAQHGDPPQSSPSADLSDASITAIADKVSTTLADRVIAGLAERLSGSIAERVGGPLADRLSDSLADRVTAGLAAQVTTAVAEHVTARVVEPLTHGVSERVSAGLADRVTTNLAGPLTDAVAERVAPAVAERIGPLVADRVTSALAEQVAPTVADRIAPVVADQVAPLVADRIAPIVADRMVGALGDRLANGLADQVAERVAVQMMQNTFGDSLRQTVNEVAERVVRAEIERIRAAADSPRS